VPGCGETGRPPLRCGTGQDARQGMCPAGPSSDLPRGTCLAISLADKAALSALALGQPRLGLPRRQPLHNRHYVEPVTGFSVNDHEPAAPVRPLAGGSPRRTSCRRAPPPPYAEPQRQPSRVLVLGLQPGTQGLSAELPRLRSKPRDSLTPSAPDGLRSAPLRSAHLRPPKRA